MYIYIYVCIMGWNHQRNRILKGFRWDFDGCDLESWSFGLAAWGFSHPNLRPTVPGLFHHWFLCLVECLAHGRTSDSKPRWPLRIIWLVIGGFTYVLNSVACLRWWSNMTTEHLWDGLKPPTVYSLICRVVLSVWMHTLRSLRARQSQESFAVESIQLFGAM